MEYVTILTVIILNFEQNLNFLLLLYIDLYFFTQTCRHKCPFVLKKRWLMMPYPPPPFPPSLVPKTYLDMFEQNRTPFSRFGLKIKSIYDIYLFKYAIYNI